MAKKYIKVKVNADLEMVVFCETEDFEDAVSNKIDEGDFEVYGYTVSDWDLLEDWNEVDLKHEYELELKQEEQEEQRRINETV